MSAFLPAVYRAILLLLALKDSFDAAALRQGSKLSATNRLAPRLQGVTGNCPVVAYGSNRVASAAAVAAIAALASFPWPRPAAALDISAAMGSFETKTAQLNGTESNGAGSMREPINTPPGTLSQFLSAPGTKQADPMTHGY